MEAAAHSTMDFFIDESKIAMKWWKFPEGLKPEEPDYLNTMCCGYGCPSGCFDTIPCMHVALFRCCELDCCKLGCAKCDCVKCDGCKLDCCRNCCKGCISLCQPTGCVWHDVVGSGGGMCCSTACPYAPCGSCPCKMAPQEQFYWFTLKAAKKAEKEKMQKEMGLDAMLDKVKANMSTKALDLAIACCCPAIHMYRMGQEIKELRVELSSLSKAIDTPIQSDMSVAEGSKKTPASESVVQSLVAVLPGENIEASHRRLPGKSVEDSPPQLQMPSRRQ